MKKYSNLLATEWLDMLSTDVLVELFKLSTSEDGTKNGGFTTAVLVINELAIRGKLQRISISKIENKELARKIIAELNNAERSAAGKISPKIAAEYAVDANDSSINPAVLALIRDIHDAEEAKTKRQEMAQASFNAWCITQATDIQPIPGTSETEISPCELVKNYADEYRDKSTIGDHRPLPI